MAVVIDTREKRSNRTFWKREIERCGIGVIINSLGDKRHNKGGDIGIWINDRECGIERKRLSDFYNSIKSGKLFRQLAMLRETFEIPILLLEHKELKINTDLGMIMRKRYNNYYPYMRLSLYHNTIFKAQMEGIFVIRCQSVHETASLVVHIHNYLSKNSHMALKGRRKADRSMSERWQGALLEIDGVGYDTAQNLIGGFDSMLDIANANMKQLLEIDGIGYKTANNIYAFFRGE